MVIFHSYVSHYQRVFIFFWLNDDDGRKSSNSLLDRLCCPTFGLDLCGRKYHGALVPWWISRRSVICYWPPVDIRPWWSLVTNQVIMVVYWSQLDIVWLNLKCSISINITFPIPNIFHEISISFHIYSYDRSSLCEWGKNLNFPVISLAPGALRYLTLR